MGLIFHLCVSVFAVSPWADRARAQDTPAETDVTSVTAASELTIDGVQAGLKAVEGNSELAPDVKAKIVDSYNKALAYLKAAAESSARRDQQLKFIGEAPAALQKLKAELAAPAAEEPLVIPADATLAQVQQQLAQSEMTLDDAQKKLVTLQEEPTRRAERRLEIPKLSDAAKVQIMEIEKLLAAKPGPDEVPEMVTATRLMLEARKNSITLETAANQAELQLFDATGELLSGQRDRAARHVVEAENKVKALRIAVSERRRQEAEQQAQEALRISAQALPAVREIAETNAELARSRQSLVAEIETAVRDMEEIDPEVKRLEDRFRKASQRYETAGATESMGLMLRKERDELPGLDAHRRNIRRRPGEISDAYLNLIDYQEKRDDLATLDQNVKDRMALLGGSVDEIERQYLEAELRRALETQRDLYDSLNSDTNSLFQKLVELDFRERELMSNVEEYAAYYDERILWIRSTTVPDANHLNQLWPSMRWLGNLQGWREVGGLMWTDARTRPVLTILVSLLFLILILGQRTLRRMLNELGEQASRSNITSYLPTLRAALATVALSLLWPGLLGYAGTRLVVSLSESIFVTAVGRGLITTALVYVTMDFFRHVCRRNGLGESHFGWDAGTTKIVRRATWWFIVFGIPLILVVAVTEAQPNEPIKNSLGRLAFVAVLLVLTVCIHFTMRPTGALAGVYATRPQAWTSRMKVVWHLMSVSAPLALGVLALSGYYYTALQLAWRLLATWWVVIGLLILHGALIRWSLLSYRDLAMRKNRERRAADVAAAAAAAAAGSPSPAAGVAKIQEQVTLADINKQTRKALQLGLAVGLVAGLWLVWVDVLPALGALRHVEVWMVETTVTSDSTTTTVLQPITLANILLAVVVSIMTFTASRNLPSLLEIAVLQRLPLDPGVRYAITTICTYVITVVGLIAAFAAIGIGWNKVQWLVAAISVGLGFGLQEIFANFVSGLILLFERPVRLGDIVTVDDVTGKVTRIRMRATTITDWDMMELVVPNREFITGRVKNWTLSTSVSRMSIVVGVAYGTDPDQVRSLLLQIASQNSFVLKEPAPHALFDEFGDSTLNFILRVYMPTRDVYIELRHSLCTEISRGFRKANIEIAFPQQDIHVRSIPSALVSPDAERPKPAAGPSLFRELETDGTA